MEVILLIGIAGSGKTTFCTKFLPNHTRISLDEVPNHDRNKQAELIENSLLEKQNIVIDDTNLTREIRSKHILIAKKHNAEIKAVFFDLPMYKIQLQNSKREKKLTDSALFKMKKLLEPPSEDEGIHFIQIISWSYQRSNLSKIMSMVSYVNDWWKVMEKTGPLDKDELEKTKWMISRIDLLHENMIGSLIASAKMFESYGEKTISKLKELRGILTAPFIGGIAILFGISESFPIDPALFTWVLIGLVSTTITIFIIFTKLIGIFENLYVNLDEVVNIQIVNLGKSQGFMTTSVADLTIVKYDFVYNYFIFSNLLVSAVMASLSNEFKKLAKQYKKFKDLKLRLEEYAKESGKDLEAVSKYFPLFDSSKFIPKDLLDFVDSSLAKYKPKN